MGRARVSLASDKRAPTPPLVSHFSLRVARKYRTKRASRSIRAFSEKRASISPIVPGLFRVPPELLGRTSVSRASGKRASITSVYHAPSLGFLWGVAQKYWGERAFRWLWQVFGETSVYRALASDLFFWMGGHQTYWIRRAFRSMREVFGPTSVYLAPSFGSISGAPELSGGNDRFVRFGETSV